MLRDKLEKKLSFLRIPNLMFIIVLVSAFIYVFDNFTEMQNSKAFITNLLYFDKLSILKGEIWRIITFVFLPFSGSLMFVILEAYFLYFLGTSLEVSLGERKFSLFYIFGVFLAIIVGFITGHTTINFLNLSMFLILATINPNGQILLFYFIPMKVFIFGILATIYFIFVIVSSLLAKNYSIMLSALAAIVNYIIFFGPRLFLDMIYSLKSMQEKSKRMYKNGNYWGS